MDIGEWKYWAAIYGSILYRKTDTKSTHSEGQTKLDTSVSNESSDAFEEYLNSIEGSDG